MKNYSLSICCSSKTILLIRNTNTVIVRLFCPVQFKLKALILTSCTCFELTFDLLIFFSFSFFFLSLNAGTALAQWQPLLGFFSKIDVFFKLSLTAMTQQRKIPNAKREPEKATRLTAGPPWWWWSSSDIIIDLDMMMKLEVQVEGKKCARSVTEMCSDSWHVIFVFKQSKHSKQSQSMKITPQYTNQLFQFGNTAKMW